MLSRPTSTARLTSAMLVAVCLAVAAPAAAQQAAQQASQPSGGVTPGLRYLSWSGKAEQPIPAAATVTTQDGLRRYPGIIPRQTAASVSAPPRPMAQPTPVSYAARPSRYSPTPSNRLTPASAWLNTGPAPAPYAEPPAAPVAYQPAPQPTHLPAPTPVFASAPSSAYADAPVPSLEAPQPGFEAAFDPMAPRRDAAVFRMGRETVPMQGSAQIQAPGAPQPVALADGSGAPLPAASAPPNDAPTAYAAAEPARQGPRYYSVHRASGHQPDAIVMPQSVYLDTAPIDLAEPPETPIPARTVNGRAQNIVSNEDPSLP